MRPNAELSAAESTAHRCLLCSSNVLDAVIEKLAEDLWESRRHSTLDDVPWERCGDHWQRVFRDFAATAVESLRMAG